MGVVHKLKEEVITFIIEQKRDHPKMSCRKLADLTSQTFETVISKSSVNTILKNHQLSNSVGRPSGSVAKSKKFKIPTVKKQQIGSDLKKLGFEPEAPTQPKNIPNPSNAVEDKGLKLIPDSIEKSSELCSKGALSEKPELLKAKNQPIKIDAREEKFIGQLGAWRTEKELNKGVLRDAMGSVFLKAAQWDISDESLLGAVLKNHIAHTSLDMFNKMCDAFSVLRLLGMVRTADIDQYKNYGLWNLDNIFSTPNKESLAWAHGFKLPADLVMRYLSEQNQMFLEVSGINVILDDKREFFLDARLTSIWSKAPSSQWSWPLNKTMSMLSRHFISNNEPLVLLAPLNETNSFSELCDVIKIFENIEKIPIIKVSVLNQEQKPIAEFTTIPNKRRLFLIGFYPWHNEFENITRNSLNEEKIPYHHKPLDRILYYSEASTSIITRSSDESACHHRTITLFDEEKRLIMTILTNWRIEEAGNIVEYYLSRWPNLEESPALEGLKNLRAIGPESKPNPGVIGGSMMEKVREFSSIWDIFNDFGNGLDGYVRRHYLPDQHINSNINHLISNIYNLEGYLCKHSNFLQVTFKTPTGYAYKKDLDRAICIINENYTLQRDGIRVFLARIS